MSEEMCAKCGGSLDDRMVPASGWVCRACYDEENGQPRGTTLPVCPLCAQRRELVRPHGVDEVAVCADCWNSSVWYLAGDHDTVIVSPYDRERLEKLRRGEQA